MQISIQVLFYRQVLSVEGLNVYSKPCYTNIRAHPEKNIDQYSTRHEINLKFFWGACHS